jgi:hypothetical protein
LYRPTVAAVESILAEERAAADKLAGVFDLAVEALLGAAPAPI